GRRAPVRGPTPRVRPRRWRLLRPATSAAERSAYLPSSIPSLLGRARVGQPVHAAGEFANDREWRGDPAPERPSRQGLAGLRSATPSLLGDAAAGHPPIADTDEMPSAASG